MKPSSESGCTSHAIDCSTFMLIARSSHLYVSMPVRGVNGSIISANPLMISSSFLSAISHGGRSGIFLSRMLIYATTDSSI